MKIYIDEVGRWPLAGEMRIGIIIWEEKGSRGDTSLFQDSKKLTEKQREIAYQHIQNLLSKQLIYWGSWSVEPAVIDQYWVTRSLNIAITKGLYQIFCKFLSIKAKKKLRIDDVRALLATWEKQNSDQITLIIDGKQDFWLSKELGIRTQTIIDGDAELMQISMASILAKVTRDHIMSDLDRKFPEYGFAKHKGYGTKAHYQAIEKIWLCPLHRKLFLKKIVGIYEISPFDIKNPLP